MIRKPHYRRGGAGKLFDPKNFKPTPDEIPDSVIDSLVTRDKSFWVDKPGLNDYALHDAFNRYGMKAEKVNPRTSSKADKRWSYYLDVTAKRPVEEIKKLMNQVGRPFHNEVCNWYYENYPSHKHNMIIRKCAK